MWSLFYTRDIYNKKVAESSRKCFANEIVENCSKQQIQTKKLDNEKKRNSTPHQYNLSSQDIETDIYGSIDKKYPFASFKHITTFMGINIISLQ